MRIINVNKEHSIIIFAAILIALLIVWIGYASLNPAYIEKVEEIEPDEVAFLIPLKDDAKEYTDESIAKDNKNGFLSEAFLEANKISSLRVTIPQRKIAVGRFTYHWIPAAQLIMVVRTPVTQEWNAQSMLYFSQAQSASNTPSSSDKDSPQKLKDKTDQKSTDRLVSNYANRPVSKALAAASKEGIEFTVDATITTSIPENGAAKFLSNFPGKTLFDVTAEDIHGFTQGVLDNEFGNKSIDECRAHKKDVFNLAREKTKKYFVEKGITISNLEFNNGLVFKDKAIQANIDANFLEQMAINKAHQERLVQEERNKMIVEKAAAESEATQIFAKNKEAAIARTNLEVETTNAQTLQTAVDKWNGVMPANIVPQGTSLLFGLDSQKKK